MVKSMDDIRKMVDDIYKQGKLVEADCKTSAQFKSSKNGLSEKAISNFKDAQRGLIIDEQTQIYIVNNYLELFEYVTYKNKTAIKHAFERYGSYSTSKQKIADMISLCDIYDFDKDLVVEMLCGLIIDQTKVDAKQISAKKKIMQLLDMPSFGELTEEDKLKIIQYNSEMIVFFDSNNSKYQEAVLKDETGKYSSIKFHSYPRTVDKSLDTVVTIIVNSNTFELNMPSFLQLISKYSDEQMKLLIENVYMNSIDAGTRWFEAYYRFQTEDGAKMYEKIISNFVDIRQKNLAEGKENSLTKEEIRFFGHLILMPPINPTIISNLIALYPDVLYIRGITDYLTKNYDLNIMKQIIEDAISKNRNVLHCVWNKFPNLKISEDVLLPIIREHPSDIVYVPMASETLCEIAFKGDPNTYEYTYKQASFETMIDAIMHDPRKIQHVTEMKIFDRLIYNYAIRIARKRNDFLAESYCEDYLKALIMSEKEKEREQAEINLRKEKIEKAIRVKEWLNLKNMVLGIVRQNKVKTYKKD